MSKLSAPFQHLKAEHNVLVLGAAVVDVIISLNKLPRTGEDVMAEHRETLVGGCAYNVSNILKQLHVKHDLFVPVGQGTYAQTIKRQLEMDGTQILLEDKRSDNGWNLSIVEQDGERTFITIPGIETRWCSDWFKQLNLESYDYIYLSGYEIEGPSGQVILDALERRRPDCKLVFDPSPRVSYIDPDILTRVLTMGTLLHLNRAELSELTGITDLYEAAAQAYAITEEPIVATLGGDGTLIYTGEGHEIIPSAQVTVVDTIGAGDSHTGAFIAGLASNLSLREACLLGNEIAGLVVQQQGGKLELA